MVLGSSLDSGGKITLDQETFKVLASETRILILKNLDKHQLTVSDLARAMEMSKATLFEHLDRMTKVGLIKKIEDERKWVYYKLTWKGKNILHPERIKIAIALSITIIFMVITAVFYMILLTSQVEPVDDVAPTIEFVQMEDINSNTMTPDNAVFEISDNQKLDKGSIITEYTVTEFYTQDLSSLSSWQDLNSSVVDDKLYITLPKIDWELETGKYLYIKCLVKDKAGNWALALKVEYIEKIYPTELDLSVTNSDINIFRDINKEKMVGVHEIPIRVRVHNNGAGNIQDVKLGIYTVNPDRNVDGVVDNSTFPLRIENLSNLKKWDYIDVDLKLSINLSRVDRLWLFVDPGNDVNESNEKNNIISVQLKPSLPVNMVVPEFEAFLIIFLVLAIVVLSSFFNKKIKKIPF